MATRREIYKEAMRQLRLGHEPHFGTKASLADAAQKTYRMRHFCHDPLEEWDSEKRLEPIWLLRALSRQRRVEISEYKEGRLP